MRELERRTTTMSREEVDEMLLQLAARAPASVLQRFLQRAPTQEPPITINTGTVALTAAGAPAGALQGRMEEAPRPSPASPAPGVLGSASPLPRSPVPGREESPLSAMVTAQRRRHRRERKQRKAAGAVPPSPRHVPASKRPRPRTPTTFEYAPWVRTPPAAEAKARPKAKTKKTPSAPAQPKAEPKRPRVAWRPRA